MWITEANLYLRDCIIGRNKKASASISIHSYDPYFTQSKVEESKVNVLHLSPRLSEMAWAT